MLTTTVCAALSAAGLAVAFLTAWRRRFVAATRIAAFSLLPVGLAMSGLAGLGGKIGKAFGTWATDLVLKPTVWAGFGVLACAFLLYVIARVAGGRASAAGPGRKERRAAARAERPRATEPAAGAPSLTPGASVARTPAAQAKKPAASGGGEDFADIEAILKKHGI
ncbi:MULTISPECIES: hypothetical protein [unclassified Streptomyces]|uniref:hypothetical protein n=1 Tax=unclassified Streptomyces TaxID=2593676 RepID=UPI002DDA3918|nr:MULTISPECIES: hypothetical protein [unclassified Streptomyces]WSA96275.1 hypothetical protein OIE63_35505 [Streptomyces sp. NBC_01795]WSB80688.1 hypothetical protein OHB04_36610 [Streptomyces sp. NBC_01775]WSS11102.1 hypothetical protein OG533_03635 [Streptomyces sp. NBC_01186]WSS39811.1 hypothetical protein OG220_03735 [Streptomyces sp. NBC_01187]